MGKHNKEVHKNQFLETLRSCFDISNTSIGHLTGASIDFVKSVSAGRRSFSLKHITPLVRLEQSLSLKRPLEELGHAKLSLNDRPKQELATRVNKLGRSIRLKEEELELLEQRMAPMRRGLHACTVLLAKDDLSAHERKWLTLRQKHLSSKLNGSFAQKVILLKARMAGLEIEKEALSQSEI